MGPTTSFLLPPEHRPLTYDKVPYWALPDLLGLFMSKLGRSPAGANKRNFYLPLTAVYEMWCKKLIGEGVTPYVFQCTWNEEGDFFLGASRGAYSRHSERPWLAVVDRARFGVIKSEPLTLAGWSLARSPCMEWRKKKDGTPFGRCAETYPFCKLLKTCGKGQAEKVYGLALSRPYLSSPHYDDRLSGPIWARLWKPCLNCKELIRIHGGKYENFLVATGSAGAPP
ncbi:hypothetical protein AKAW_03382 [Aspergillus luchuensis IFO 4308]|nr:hypothetical protein AKAW_03382 [Aspergillus luchuensis IFO 4308]